MVRSVSSYLVAWDSNPGYVTSSHVCGLFSHLCGHSSHVYRLASHLSMLLSLVYAGSLLDPSPLDCGAKKNKIKVNGSDSSYKMMCQEWHIVLSLYYI